MNLPGLASRAYAAALDLLFPPRCIGCRREGAFLCPSCLKGLPVLREPFCLRCAQPLARGDRCGRCSQAPLEIDGIRATFLMEGAIREAVHRLKYQNLRALAPLLGDLMARYLESWPIPCQVLVPVPLHPSRQRGRGYNQSFLLAQALGKGLRKPVESRTLIRTRPTASQAQAASAEQRRANVTGAFACRDARLAGAQVLLIDDVCTTGATLEACAVALKAAGVSSVWGLALAREP